MIESVAGRRTLRAIAAAGALAACGACGNVDPFPDEHAPEGEKPPGAFGIAAEPGPSDGKITVTWSPVADAETYALYFGTAAGVTTTNSTRIAGAPTAFVHSQLATGSTYYYVVAAVNRDIEGPQSNEVFATPMSAIGLHVETPAAGDLVDTSVPIVVAVNAAQALTSLVASAGSTTAPLAFDASIGRWTGSLSFSGVESPSGRQIKLVATDSHGNTALASAIVRLDHPPVLTVTSPAAQAAASPTVHIAATCSDDFRLGCASLIAYVDGSRTSPLLAGTVSIDANVTLENFGLGVVHLVIEAIDSAGQVTIVRRDVIRQ